MRAYCSACSKLQKSVGSAAVYEETLSSKTETVLRDRVEMLTSNCNKLLMQMVVIENVNKGYDTLCVIETDQKYIHRHYGCFYA